MHNYMHTFRRESESTRMTLVCRDTLTRRYSLLHLECHFISISNLNLLGLFSTERGKRDL